MGEIITQEVPYTGKGALLHKKVLYTGMGKRYTETSLWTNPSPSSGFAAQDVTLSQSLENFKYIKIRYKVSTSVATESSEIWTVADFKVATIATYNSNLLSLVTRTSSGFSRVVLWKNANTVTFQIGYKINAQANDNTVAIPLEILGLNELDQGKSGGPMFSIATCSGGSTTFYSTHVISNDSSLVEKSANQNSSGTVTVKRAAKGKIYFDNSGRGTRSVNASFTFKGVSYNPNNYWLDYQSGISVDFSANDTIAYSCGKSVNLDTAILIFVEDA